MKTKKLSDINEYVGSSVNPLATPDQMYELYSVPSFEDGYPEIILGADIGSTKVTVEEGDILICKINPRINRVWVVHHNTEFPLLASSEWIVIRNKEMNSDFLKWYFSSQRFRMLLTSQVTGIGGSLTRAQPKQVAKYPVPYPPREQQDCIANHIGKVYQLIKLYQQRLTLLDEIVKSRFIELFGDPIKNPKGYLKETINKHIDLLSGYPFKSEQYVDEGINICGGLIIMPQKIKWDECVHWGSIDGFEDYLLEENDIVMALDRPWISEGFKIAKIDAEHLPALLIQRTARIRAIDINQDYLYYCFVNGGFDKHSNVTGSLVPHISAKDIRSFEVMIPPIELQNQFADLVHQVDKSKLAAQKGLQELETLKKSLMQQYFG